MFAVGVLSATATAGTPTVRFTGNQRVATPVLRAAMTLPLASATAAFDADALERDLLLVSAYYWDHGYANVRVGAPVIDAAASSITIPVEEGDTFAIGEVTVTGALVGGMRANRDRLGVRAGELFSRSRIAADRERLQAYYEDRGYAFANVLPLTKVDAARRTIALAWEVTPGPIATVDQVTVLDADALLEAQVRQALAIAPGARFSGAALRTGKARIAALPHVANVVVSTKRGSAADRIALTIEITDDRHN